MSAASSAAKPLVANADLSLPCSVRYSLVFSDRATIAPPAAVAAPTTPAANLPAEVTTDRNFLPMPSAFLSVFFKDSLALSVSTKTDPTSRKISRANQLPPSCNFLSISSNSDKITSVGRMSILAPVARDLYSEKLMNSPVNAISGSCATHCWNSRSSCRFSLALAIRGRPTERSVCQTYSILW